MAVRQTRKPAKFTELPCSVSDEHERRRNGFGIPDWRFVKNYPTDLTAPDWAWEFLRRNDEYRADYARVANSEGARPEPKTKRNESATESDAPPHESLQFFLRKWHLQGSARIDALPNPALRVSGDEYVTQFAFELLPHVDVRSFDLLPDKTGKTRRPISLRWKLEIGQIAIRFDCAHSIDGQLEIAKMFIKDVRVFTETHYRDYVPQKPSAMLSTTEY